MWHIPHFQHQHLRPMLGSSWMPWPCASAGWPPAWSSFSLLAGSALHLLLYTARLPEIHNKMSRGSISTGSNYKGASGWFRVCLLFCVCLFFLIVPWLIQFWRKRNKCVVGYSRGHPVYSTEMDRAESLNIYRACLIPRTRLEALQWRKESR